ncbi:hypothetical protein [Cyclobacterium jeungdonense]|uniref:VLRF1 domain-containing protein n=1 Tax=Cyclobacterium jeungdonense TaxID=708087 RepID=A0ABT8CCU5_9BACT|nr:hypothetical protein [Cyclobacterium jeungdonense]MDN3690216.1 hypothetical protein [Cyclobacterium jeungdonense]
MHRLIKADTLPAFLDWIKIRAIELEYLPSQHKLNIYKDGIRVGALRLPLHYNWEAETGKIWPKETNWILFMVRAGIAAVGYFENGSNISHNVYRAYMVRKKQGKSQIKYLKTKGKSRAGSRVRLGEAEVFFQEIHEKVTSYLRHHPVDMIGYSCSKTLWPFIFNAGTGIDKDDPRLYKIPLHVQHPTYETLLQVNETLQAATLEFEEELSDWFKDSGKPGLSPYPDDEDEQW